MRVVKVATDVQQQHVLSKRGSWVRALNVLDL